MIDVLGLWVPWYAVALVGLLAAWLLLLLLGGRKP